MTEELPKQPKSKPVFCENCNAAARLERMEDDLLVVKCACPEVRELKPTLQLPEGWQE